MPDNPKAVRWRQEPLPGAIAGALLACVTLAGFDRWLNPPEPLQPSGPPVSREPRALRPPPVWAAEEHPDLPKPPSRRSHLVGVLRGREDPTVVVTAPPVGALRAIPVGPSAAPAPPPLPEEIKARVEEVFARLEGEREWGAAGGSDEAPEALPADDPVAAGREAAARASFVRLLGETHGQRLAAELSSGLALVTACRRSHSERECHRASRSCLLSSECGRWLAVQTGVLSRAQADANRRRGP